MAARLPPDIPVRVTGEGVLYVLPRPASGPGRAMHSFQAGHNEVRWLVRVEGEADRRIRLKFAKDFRLDVRPPRGGGGVS